MNPKEKLAIIADDFTGAGDSGIPFTRAGIQVELLLGEGEIYNQLDGCHGISLSTESRFLDREDAFYKVEEYIYQCQKAGIWQFFKKIDSTLRGNPGAEIEAALKATGKQAAIICTAMPGTGRSCRNGSIYIGNQPLHLTDISEDPFNPIRTSSVAELLQEQTSLPMANVSIDDIEAGAGQLEEKITSLLKAGIRLIIADAENEVHLARLAEQLLTGELLPVGAGGFAGAIASSLRGCEGAKAPDLEKKRRGPVLAVIGSLSTTSQKQAQLACSRGRFLPINICVRQSLEEIKKEISLLFRSLGEQRPHLLMRVGQADHPGGVSKQQGERVASLMGDVAAFICENYPVGSVFSTGGSTAMGVARALGIGKIRLVDEIMPGVVLGACEVPGCDVEWFISKAGGFGDQNILENIADSFQAAEKE